MEKPELLHIHTTIRFPPTGRLGETVPTTRSMLVIRQARVGSLIFVRPQFDPRWWSQDWAVVMGISGSRDVSVCSEDLFGVFFGVFDSP